MMFKQECDQQILHLYRQNWRWRGGGASYRYDQWRDSAGEAGEHSAKVKHPNVLCCDDDSEAEDERQRAEHQTELPADLIHHPSAQQATKCCSHRHYGLKNKQHTDSGHNLVHFICIWPCTTTNSDIFICDADVNIWIKPACLHTHAYLTRRITHTEQQDVINLKKVL